mgnify:CR=1 FL=1
MHITELRIAGFKSFVDPQEFPVETGLTGIVGPNGCGKSNLLEALRWVMGASSAKAMRGGEMDDLIFSGSEARPARETAEVTLVLDNSDRTAPAEFNASDTLEVLRRLRRGAGSTYKLNGRTVRGKDIQLLFADASTGANSPSLVRQGQISELIASKPQNRRRILEEAAGIAGLNSRRHEAELKLRAAETNLERLTEVTAEVERQLESLKRQARKARKYKALSEEIAALDAYVAHLKWEAALDAREAAGDALKTARDDVERLTREEAVAETRRIEAGEGLGPLREAEATASARLGQAKIALARLETERKSAEDAARRLEAEKARLIEDMEREQAACEEAETAIAAARAELDALPVEDGEENEAREAEARAALDAAGARLKSAEAEADQAQERLAEARARREAARANEDAARKRVAKLEAEARRLAEDVSQLPDMDALSAQSQQAAAMENDTQSRLDAAQEAVESAEARLAEAREAETAIEPERAEADQAVRTLEAEIAGLKRLLRRAEGPKAPPVIERIRTANGYEKAVAAALGDDLQAPTDRGAALYWAGREMTATPLPEGAEPLSRFVEAPGELAARLSQCGVVDAEAGEAMAARLQPGQRLVSADGHLWRWDGFVRTPEAPVSEAERLEQQARLEAAEAELAPARQMLEVARSKSGELKSRREAADSALKSARAEIAPLTRAISEARKHRESAGQALERAAMKRESAEAALARAESDLAGARDALEELTPSGPQTSLESLETQLATAREALAAARETEKEARGRLNDLTHNRQQAEKRRAALERDVESWSQRKRAAEARLETLVARRREATEEAKDVSRKPESLAAEIANLTQQVESHEAARKTAADTLAEREAAQREAESAARAATSAAANARESLAASRARLEAAETRLEEVVEAAKDTFQRAPEGLMTLARAGLEADDLAALDQREAENRSMVLKRDRDALGGVNMEAESEAEDLASRLGSQASEKEDLTAAIAKLREGVDELNQEGRARLLEAFETVNNHFKALFTALFRGGHAELRLVEADDPLASGLEIMAQPPGKRLGTLSLMSGGEQALTATALIFAVFLSRPAPICVLDEVDAPLDDANVDRFCRMLDEMRRRTDTRFIVITHNPVTMSRMDRLFGVTMREKGVSKLVSVDLGTAEELVAAE